MEGRKRGSARWGEEEGVVCPVVWEAAGAVFLAPNPEESLIFQTLNRLHPASQIDF